MAEIFYREEDDEFPHFTVGGYPRHWAQARRNAEVRTRNQQPTTKKATHQMRIALFGHILFPEELFVQVVFCRFLL